MKIMKMECGKKHLKPIMILNHMVRIIHSLKIIDSNFFLQGPSSIGVDVNFLNFENVYGIPEHADAFALRSTQ
jgi:hypothetical protein